MTVSAKQTKRGLGRNFGSLLPGDFDESILLDKQDRVQKLFISSIQPDPNQPRKHFDETALTQLSESIKRHGVLQPLVVSPKGDDFIIIAGERRFRAAKKAGLKQLPAIVRTSEELERTEIGLVENVQRVDLSPIEQAVSIMKLHEQFNVSYADIAKRLGKAETTVVNTARLLQLPKDARLALEQSKITEGHARAILALRNQPPKQKQLLSAILRSGLSVRRAEQFVAGNKKVPAGKKPPKAAARAEKHAALSKKLDAEVRIVRGPKGGKIQINFDSQEQLKKLIDSLG
jgi:ParB family chromosome partitioning protein